MPAFLGIAPLFWYIVSGSVLLVFGMMIGVLLTGLGRAAAKPAPKPTHSPSGHPLRYIQDGRPWLRGFTVDPTLHVNTVPSASSQPATPVPEWMIEKPLVARKQVIGTDGPTLRQIYEQRTGKPFPMDHPLDSTQSWVPPTDDDGVA